MSKIRSSFGLISQSRWSFRSPDWPCLRILLEGLGLLPQAQLLSTPCFPVTPVMSSPAMAGRRYLFLSPRLSHGSLWLHFLKGGPRETCGGICLPFWLSDFERLLWLDTRYQNVSSEMEVAEFGACWGQRGEWRHWGHNNSTISHRLIEYLKSCALKKCCKTFEL